MTDLPFGALEVVPALDRLDLVSVPTAAALRAWTEVNPDVVSAVGVTAIDPALSDTAALVAAYDIDPAVCANCVLVLGRRGDRTELAAALVRADSRADVNGTVRRLLDVRKASFLPTDDAVARSGMEFGAITPVGLADPWRLLIDRGVIDGGPALIGSGVRHSKLTLPGAILATLPGAQIIDGLALT